MYTGLSNRLHLYVCERVIERGVGRDGGRGEMEGGEDIECRREGGREEEGERGERKRQRGGRGREGGGGKERGEGEGGMERGRELSSVRTT